MKKKNERHIAIILAVMMIFMNFIIAPVMAAPGDVAIDATKFPDAKFMEYVKKFDKDKDNTLSQGELNAVKRINVQSIGITKLKGVEHFTELERLDCRSNHLAVLDLKDNTKLISLLCAGNQLTNLNLSQNKNLVTLYCEQNQLTNLNLSNNAKLENLSCSYNQLTNLDLSNNSKVTTFDGSDQAYDIKVSTSTLKFDLQSLPGNFDPSMASGWNVGTVEGNTLTLDSTKPTTVKYNYKVNNGDKNINVTLKVDYGNFVTVSFDKNGGEGSMKSEVISQGSNYTLPACTFNPPTGKEFDKWEVNGTKYDAGASIRVNSNITVKATWKVIINEKNFPDAKFMNYVKGFDTNHDDALSQDELNNVTEIDVENNGITSLKGVEHFTKLKELNCRNNKLTELDVKSNKELTDLNCRENQLTELDVKSNTELLRLNCDCNQLTELDVKSNKELILLAFYDNKLTTLDISKNTKLSSLSCSATNLEDLDLSNNTNLKFLYCAQNQLKTLDLSKNTNLETLYCTHNQLTNLDLSKNTKLTLINCTHNQLTNLDLSNNSKVTTFDGSDQVYDIKVNASTLNFDLESLPGKFDSSMASDWVGGKVDTVNSNILKLDKNTITAVTYKYNTGHGDLNVTLKVKYSIETVTVTFNTNGGSAVASQTITAGGKVAKPTDPTKDGYTFDGWYKEAALATAFDFENDTINDNTIIYAKWTENPPIPPTSYTVTFNTNGGSAVASQTITAGGKVTKPTDPTKDGYTFAGWYKDAALATAFDFTNETINDNTIIYAKWTEETTPTPPTPTPDPYYPGYDDWYEPYRPHRPHRPSKPAEDKKAEEKPEEKPIDKPANKIETEVIFVIGSNNMDTKINGTDSFKGMDAAPYIKNGRTMLPIRYIAEALGMSVSWDAKTRTVIIGDLFYTVEIPVDTNIIKVNGEVFTSDVKPEIVHGRTMLPIANIARALGLVDGKDIIWDASKRQVIIKRIYDKKEN